MQISKTVLTFCLLAACAVPAVFADPDSEAQAKAREALRQKLADVPAPPAAGVPTATAPAATAPAAATQPAPAPAPFHRLTPEQAARAREAMRNKISEVNAQEPAAPTPVAPPPVVKVKPVPAPKPAPTPAPVAETKPAPSPKPVKTVRAPKPAPTPTPAPVVETKPAPPPKPVKTVRTPKPAPEPKAVAAAKPEKPAAAPVTSRPVMAPAKTGFSPIPTNPGLAPDQDEKLRGSLRQKISEGNAQDQAAHVDTSTVAVAPPPGKEPKRTVAAPAPANFPPIVAPPTPLPASKESRLADLLRQYKADTITPEQYHIQRAKILAEP